MSPSRAPRALAVIAIASAALVASTALLTAGPIAPSAGPVASTYRTLTEVEPRTPISASTTPGDADSVFRISQPGSYYLTGNFTGVAGRAGIEIASSNVTLDLGGFTLRGVPGSLDGIGATAPGLARIAIRDGAVVGFGGDGIDLDGEQFRVEGVKAASNLGVGIAVGAGATLVDCAAQGNTLTGILASTGAIVDRCTASANLAAGMAVGAGSTVTASTAAENASDGFATGAACVVTACAATYNNGNGFSLLTGSVITGCYAEQNQIDGIRVTTACLVRSNTCVASGSNGDGANIHATSADNRIEANACHGADRGIDVDVQGNFITRNTVAGATTDYTVVAGNVCLVVAANTNAVAISGTSGGAATGSNDPNANFSY